MYYSAIGLLGVMILLIENQDILLNNKGAFEKPVWKVYRRFLLAVLAYYIMDILWGFLENRKGRILEGLDADFVILSGDPVTEGPANVRVAAVYSRGRKIYEAEDTAF